MEKPKTIKKSLNIDVDIADAIDIIAKEEMRTFTNMCNIILREYVDNWKKTQKKDEQ